MAIIYHGKGPLHLFCLVNLITFFRLVQKMQMYFNCSMLERLRDVLQLLGASDSFINNSAHLYNN